MALKRVYKTVCVGLSLDAATRRRVWLLRSQQRQAFNVGVELGLGAADAGETVPSAYDGFKVLQQRRNAGLLPSPPIVLQRPGVRAGLVAVSKWHETVLQHERNVEYWEGRAEDAPNRPRDDALEYSQRKLSVAVQRRHRHSDKGRRRLFRSRKQFEREPSNGAALVFDERVRVSSGVVVLPGGVSLPLTDPEWAPEEGWELRGSVQIVDTTPRVTRITEPVHRKYEAHFQLRREQILGPLPETEDEIVGVDAGVVIPMVTSDGGAFCFVDEDEITAEIEALQQSRACCTYRSRMWRKRTFHIRRLEAQRANRRTDASRHIAKAIAAIEGVKAVGAEDCKAKNLISSGKGTATHPGRNVAAKRGLNRVLSNARFGGVRKDTERACAMRGKHYVPVSGAYTSQTCHNCGCIGTRETQASFRCDTCGWEGNADLNAANTVKHRTWSHIEAIRRLGQPSLDDRPGGKPGQRVRVPVTIPNKYRHPAQLRGATRI